MTCPFNQPVPTSSDKNDITSKGPYYSSYLALDKILDAQHLLSEEAGMPAHDEHLFIIIHQVYELWFKQILFEMSSVMKIFSEEFVEHKQLALAVSRLHRITEIQRVLISQIDVLETMTPLQFLEFRNHLSPASGFQSTQFRKVEILMGLTRENRLTYGHAEYSQYLSEQHSEEMKQVESQKSLFDLIESWLERTPFTTNHPNFNFQQAYTKATFEIFENEKKMVAETLGTSETQKANLISKIDERIDQFTGLFDEEKHKIRQSKGEWRLSLKALQAALMITLYQDEPLLHFPFQLINKLQEIDKNFTTWRYRHSQMVFRMLGDKVGTGGSSGYRYLQAAASRHKVFQDFFNLSTFLIPTYQLPELPADLKQMLSFTYEVHAQKK